MASPLLVVGNKLYASWSLRVWFLMRAFGLRFEHKVVSIYQVESKPKILEHSPSGRVPVLLDGNMTVWDSLAITEYLADKHPEMGIWPREREARAFARAIAAEMHAEFRTLRASCPMNLGKRFGPKDRGESVRMEVARICGILNVVRARFGSRGPYLFGSLSAADAFYLPVLTRSTLIQLQWTQRRAATWR
jgi:glutathione S-transferase